MKLYYNPVSSYSQKTLMAFYEKGVEFTPEIVNLMDAAARAAYERAYPIGKVPFLVAAEEGVELPESSIIIEWLDNKFPERGPRLIPAERALEVRLRDRFADLCLNEPMQKVFFDRMRPAGQNDPFGVAAAQRLLDRAYGVLDSVLAKSGGPWMLGESFTMADCAAAPAVGYLRMVHPYPDYPHILAYAGRLAERPSFVRVMNEAAPFLAQFAGKAG